MPARLRPPPAPVKPPPVRLRVRPPVGPRPVRAQGRQPGTHSPSLHTKPPSRVPSGTAAPFERAIGDGRHRDGQDYADDDHEHSPPHGPLPFSSPETPTDPATPGDRP